MDEELQRAINNLQSLANKLALEGRLMDATITSGGIIAIQVLRTKLEPAPVTAEPVAELPPEEKGAG